MRISDATLVVVDTETTGLDYAAGDRIVEFAASIRGGATFSTLVNPGRPIPVLASAVHHLIDADVARAPQLDAAYRSIDEFVPSDAVVVAHNSVFDHAFLPPLHHRRWLCTKRLAQHLIKDAPGYRNQDLRYFLGGAHLDLQGQAPHRALADVIVTSFVLERLLERYLAAGHHDDVDALVAFAVAPIAYTSIPFGKHRGTHIERIDAGWIKWALGKTDLDPDLRLSLEREQRRRKGVAA